MSHSDQTKSRSAEERAAAERMLHALRSGSDVRLRKVRRLRGAVRAAAYENPLKIHVALDRLATDLCDPGPLRQATLRQKKKVAGPDRPATLD